MIGRIVCSKAGRDKGYFMVAVKVEGNFLHLCDGKERPLERTKRKNIKHINLTTAVLDESSYKSNKSLRKALAIYRDSTNEGRNQNV